MIEILWFSGELIVSDPNTPPSVESPIESKLIYIHKSLESKKGQPWIKETVKEKVKLAREVPGMPVRTFVTYQGLLDRVCNACAAMNIPYQIRDMRDAFPKPQVDKMHGFRHSQFSTLINFLSKNRSGILKAPTRYGKTILIINVMRAFPGIPIVLAAPGVDLLGQLVSELKAALPDREIKGLFTGSKDKHQSSDITVCSLDSLEKVDPEQVQLLLLDEPHAAAAPSRILNVDKFKRARRLGFGATTEGRFDGADVIVEGIVGPVLFAKTFREAVKEGAVCPIVVYVLEIPFHTFPCSDRNAAYRKLMFANEAFNTTIQQISSDIVPEDWQTLIFADQIKQIDLVHACVEHGVTAIASRMNKREREERFAGMKSGNTKRCIATNIYSTGVTFPDLRCVINAAGGGGSITGTQKPGRLAQVRPNKKAGYVIDFSFEPIGWEGGRFGPTDKWASLIFDTESRLRVYRENGYDVRVVKSLNEIVLE